MNESKDIRGTVKGMRLHGTRGLAVLVAVAVMAFFLGAIFFGGGEEVATDSHEGHDHSQEASSDPTTWTCSMHPQIKLPKEGKCPICFMDLIPLESGGDDLGPRQLRLSETAKQLARIQTTSVSKTYAETEIRMVGKVAYDETRLSYITAWVPGRLDRLYADYTGITVAKGDHMVYMYSPELLAAQEELLQAAVAIKSLSQTTSSVLRSTADATLTAARDKLRLFGLTQDQIDQIESGGKSTEHLTINAPVGGVVVHKNAQEGMYVQTGTRIYTIADLSKLWVIFEAYESDLPWLKYGQQVEFSSPSFPGDTFEGIISFIDPTVDPQKRTVRVRAIVDNRKQRLKPDMFVHGLIRSKIDSKGRVVDTYLAGKWISPMHPEIVKNGPGKCDVCGMDLVPAESLGYTGKAPSDEDAPLLIPASAPMITGKRAVVYLEIPDDEGPLFEGREIELGPRAGDFYVVKSGIEEGEMVVTNGAFKLDAELQIQAKPSMMSPEGGSAPPGHQHGPTEKQEPSHEGHLAASDADTQSPAAVEALTPVYTSYFDLQMALAKDDLDNAIRSTKDFGDKVSEVDMSVFSRKRHNRWMELSNVFSERVSQAANADDIETVRDAFYYISKSIIDLHETFGHAEDRDFYLTYCPMARNDKGAYWLQLVDTVWNSFYGASMLRCGEIKQPLPASSHGGDN